LGSTIGVAPGAPSLTVICADLFTVPGARAQREPQYLGEGGVQYVVPGQRHQDAGGEFLEGDAAAGQLVQQVAGGDVGEGVLQRAVAQAARGGDHLVRAADYNTLGVFRKQALRMRVCLRRRRKAELNAAGPTVSGF